MKSHWLRYGELYTGFIVYLGEKSFGFRWSRKVWKAPVGPFYEDHKRFIRLDAQTLSPKLLWEWWETRK